jgi:hypothetical protein
VEPLEYWEDLIEDAAEAVLYPLTSLQALNGGRATCDLGSDPMPMPLSSVRRGRRIAEAPVFSASGVPYTDDSKVV